MKFIDDTDVGFAPMADIAVVPQMATGWPCLDCRATLQEPDTLCPACSNKRNTAHLEAIKNIDIARLGGLKAYNQFKLENYTNSAVIKLCESYPCINIFIWGSAGTGKTHLATALVRKFTDAKIIKPQHIYRECRGLKDGRAEQSAINKYVDIPYLVIDDLGVDKQTEWSFSTLYEIIDGRDMACKKGMIITSNLSLGALSQKMSDDRIVSRIAGMCKIVELNGKDRRLC